MAHKTTGRIANKTTGGYFSDVYKSAASHTDSTRVENLEGTVHCNKTHKKWLLRAVTWIPAIEGKEVLRQRTLDQQCCAKPQLQLSQKHLNIHLLYGSKRDDKILQYVLVLWKNCGKELIQQASNYRVLEYQHTVWPFMKQEKRRSYKSWVITVTVIISW